MEKFDSRQYLTEEFPFNIVRMSHDTHNTPRPHYHDFIELVYVVSGSAMHLFEGERYRLEAGNVFIINPGEGHTFAMGSSERMEIINCLFQPQLIVESIIRELDGSEMMDYFYIHPFLDPLERFNHILRLQGDEATRVLHLLETMEQELVDNGMGYQTIIRMRMVELLMVLSRYYQSTHSPLRQSAAYQRRVTAQRINGYLERHFQQKITQSSLAERFNISTRQLNRIFREELGMSVVERIHQIRIERAKLLLQQTSEKVITIAAMVGYEDPAFFTHLFTREAGCSPGRYRTMSLNEFMEEREHRQHSARER